MGLYDIWVYENTTGPRPQCVIRVFHALWRFPCVLLTRQVHQDVGGCYWVRYRGKVFNLRWRWGLASYMSHMVAHCMPSLLWDDHLEIVVYLSSSVIVWRLMLATESGYEQLKSVQMVGCYLVNNHWVWGVTVSPSVPTGALLASCSNDQVSRLPCYCS